ncbi:MAG: hypothetical protein QNJ81_14880 [Acidimicrobiia bacterium]|nr:hypothetical protein [Acidimicrobiia bacterium]
MSPQSAAQGEPAVAVGSSQRPWVAELMSYAQDHAGVRVVGTVFSSREALELPYDVLVVDDAASFLTKRLINRVQATGRIVIGVFEAVRGDTGRLKLQDMGVDATIDADSSPREFLTRIRHTCEQLRVDQDFAEIVADESRPIQRGAEPSAVPEPASGPGRLTVVSGSNGTTEVSVALARALASKGRRVLLADLNTVEPTLAQRLSLDLTPNLLTAVELLRHAGEVAPGGVRHGAGFQVIPGLPTPREWEMCSPDEATDLILEMKSDDCHVIARVDRQLEDLAPFGVRAGRYGVARGMVAVADELVAVGDPSPTGVTALLGWIGEARALTRAPVHVVLNHCGRSLFQRGEVVAEIRRTFGPTSVSFAPEDHRVRKAAWQGEVVANGRFSRAIADLAGILDRPHTVSGVEA